MSGEAAALTGALNTAFAPAITTAYGEENWERVRSMAYQACKFGTLLTLLFAIPMGLEMSELLRIWLKDVPQWTEGICLVMLAVVVVEKFSLGHGIGVNASGRVARFQVYRGIACLTAIPFAIGATLVFRHVYAVAFALLATTCLACCSDVWIARSRIGLSVRYWLFKIIIPLVVVCGLVCAVGIVPHWVMPPSFLRIVVTTATTLVCLLPLSWFFVLNVDERLFILQKFSAMINRFRK